MNVSFSFSFQMWICSHTTKLFRWRASTWENVTLDEVRKKNWNGINSLNSLCNVDNFEGKWMEKRSPHASIWNSFNSSSLSSILRFSVKSIWQFLPRFSRYPSNIITSRSWRWDKFNATHVEISHEALSVLLWKIFPLNSFQNISNSIVFKIIVVSQEVYREDST